MLERLRKHHPTDSLDIAKTLTLLGSVIQAQDYGKRFGEAEKMFREGLKIYQKKVGQDDYQYEAVEEYLANLLTNKGRLMDAELLYSTW